MSDKLVESNPFPNNAIANLIRLEDEYVTVETKEIRLLKERLKERLTAEPRKGFSVMITGEAGAGKTHLLREMVQHVRNNEFATPIIVESSPEFFTSLAVRLRSEFQDDVIIELLDKNFKAYAISSVLNDIQIDVLKKEEKKSGFLIDQFLSNIDHDVAQLKEEFWADFAPSVNQYTRSAFKRFHLYDGNLFDWNQYCDERLINSGNELEIVSFFRCCSELSLIDDKRVSIFSDEVEKIITSYSQNETAKLNKALKDLLETCSAYGHFLFFAGLNDFLESIKTEVYDRFNETMNPANWESETLKDFIAIVATQSGKEVHFTADAIKAIINVAGGSPRLVIKNLFQIYADVVLSKKSSTVRIEDVRRVTRGTFEVRSIDSIKRDIESCLEREKVSFTTDQEIDILQADRTNHKFVFDFIVEPETGIEIRVVITSSLLEKRDVNKYIKVVDDVDKSRINVFVVNGYISPASKNALKASSSNKLIYVRPSFFEDDFADAFENYVDTVRRERNAADMEGVSRHIRQANEIVEFSLRRLERKITSLEVEGGNRRTVVDSPHSSFEQDFYKPLSVLDDDRADLIRQSVEPLYRSLSITRMHYTGLVRNEGDPEFSRGRRYRASLTSSFRDEIQLNRFCGNVSTVIWVLSAFCDQLANHRIASVRESGSSKRNRKNMRYLATFVSEMLQEPLQEMIETQDAIQYFFDRNLEMRSQSNREFVYEIEKFPEIDLRLLRDICYRLTSVS
ncbi:MAG: hypothetical protein AAFR71_02615 [Pseudomonadota bacterium]